VLLHNIPKAWQQMHQHSYRKDKTTSICASRIGRAPVEYLIPQNVDAADNDVKGSFRIAIIEHPTEVS
jgi:hypothetical protein